MPLCDKTASHMLSLIAAIYGIFIYSIAFALEMWFIIISPNYEFVTSDELAAPVPVFAFILAALFFITVVVSLLLMLGIIIRSLVCLMTWIITIILVFFPECGLVLYLSIYKWGLERNGQIELCFYIVRAIMNVFFVVCVQNLLSQWKAEKQVSSYAMSISGYNNGPSSIDVLPYFDSNSTTINPVFKYTSAMNASHVPTSEFDTRSFQDIILRKSFYEDPTLSSPHSTQSLDRRKLKKLKHSSSFKEEVILRPLYHRPFDYLQRPGSISNLRELGIVERSFYDNNSFSYGCADQSDHKSSTQSIRDVAL